MPGQLVIQWTDHCNARCPQCGMRMTESFERTRLSADRVRNIIDAAAEKGVRALSFTGGEPMMFRQELIELIRHAGRAGIPFLRTGTNGFFFTGSHKPDFTARIERIAEALAETPLRNFWISLDSAVPEIHESMRGFPGVVAGIEKALPIFHRYGLYPSVNLGINRNLTRATRSFPPDGGDESPVGFAEQFSEQYRNAFRAFYRLAIDLGFTIVNSCYPMSIEAEADQLNPVYAASSVSAVVRYTSREKALLFKALSDTIPEFRSRIRIFSPRTSLLALCRQYEGDTESPPYPCRGGIDFFFIDARDGKTYPCGYRGNENMGEFRDLNRDAIRTEPGCKACDWECFRDPSELLGPLLRMRSAPGSWLRKFTRDPLYRRLWFEDLKYYRACDLFDGRLPPNEERLRVFDRPAEPNFSDVRADAPWKPVKNH